MEAKLCRSFYGIVVLFVLFLINKDLVAEAKPEVLELWTRLSGLIIS